MASPLVLDENSQHKLRTSASDMNCSYSEMYHELSNSCESSDLSMKKFKTKRPRKDSPLKNNRGSVSQNDKKLPKQHLSDVTTSDSKKLFSIFTSSPSSQSQVKTSFNKERNGEEEKKDQTFNSNKAQEISLSTNESKNVLVKDRSANESISSQEKKGGKSVSEVTEKFQTIDEVKELSVNKQSGKNFKASNKNVNLKKVTAIENVTADEKVSTSVKRKRKISNKKTDVSENVLSSDGLLTPKIVTLKKQSITEFFQRIPNTQETVNESTLKLFPIFSKSNQRENITPSSSPLSDTKEGEKKKRKIDEEQAAILVTQIKTPTSGLEISPFKEKINISKSPTKIISENVSTDMEKSSPVTKKATPLKRGHKISLKGRNKTFGAAVLRSCNSKSTQINDENNLIDELEDSKESSEIFVDDVVEIELEKKNKKMKPDVLKMLPQSRKSFKKSKDNSVLRLTVKSADKLFPLFLKSPAALAKKKSIELVNSLAKKKAGISKGVKVKQNGSSKVIELTSDDITKVTKMIKRKRGRPRKVQNDNLQESSTEIQEILEELPIQDSENVDTSENMIEMPKNMKRKVGRPKKVQSSTLSPKKSCTDVKEILENLPDLESEVVDALDNKIEASKNIKRKAGRPRKVQSSTLSPNKCSVEVEEIPEDLPREESEIDDIFNNITETSENFKRKTGRLIKVQSSVLSLKRSSKADKETLEELPSEEVLDVFDNVTRTSQDFNGKAGSTMKVQSSTLSSEKSSTEVKEILEIKETENVFISDNVNEAFKKNKSKSGRVRKILNFTSSQNKSLVEKEEIFGKLPTEVDVISDNLSEMPERSIRKSLRLKQVQISIPYMKNSTEIEETLEELSDESTEKGNHTKKKSIKTFKGKILTQRATVKKGQPLSKKLKIISPKKNTSNNLESFKVLLDKNTEDLKNESKKQTISPEAKVIELSDESIEELGTLPDEDIQFETGNVSNAIVIEKYKKVYVPSKKAETCFAFPVYSHCGYIKTSPETILSFDIKEEESSNIITIPKWKTVIGLTEIKTVEQEILKNIVEEGLIAHTLSSSAKESNNTLWTNIENDYNLKEGVSESTISELSSWLKQWKSKFTKNAKYKSDKDDSFDSYSYDSNDSDGDGLSNCVILMGQPGSGKTSLVFSLANQHGFKVLEVNASSSRSGRNISHQLKEALESYHVENTKVTDVRIVEEKESNRDTSNAVKGTTSKKPIKKGIASFFQKENSQSVIDKEENKVPSVKNFFQPKFSSSKTKSKVINEKSNQSSSENIEVYKDSSLCSISSQTIILFDDVDVVFQEDEGFWSTIRGFLKISKKPVIFTVSRNLEVVKANLDVDIQVLHLKPMINDLAIQKLQEQFKKHHRENTNLNIELLVANSNDVRRNLLHAQFWSQVASNQKVSLDEKILSTNTFLLGSLDSSAVDSLVFDKPASNTCKLISDYHQIGYDILHANLFSLFNVINEQETKREWHIVTERSEVQDKSDSESKPETVNGIPQTELWQEACKVFEFKKRALQNGSSSKDLFLFSNILEDFSFVDTLKGHYCKNTNWISSPERLKQWTFGLPMYNDNQPACSMGFTLEAVSVIQVLRLKDMQKLYSQQCTYNQDKTMPLVLEHSFMNFDNSNGNKTEGNIEIIASAVPANLSLTKSVLNLDYLSILKIIGHDELLRQSRTAKRSNRFLHYFDSISLFLDKFQIEQILQS